METPLVIFAVRGLHGFYWLFKKNQPNETRLFKILFRYLRCFATFAIRRLFTIWFLDIFINFYDKITDIVTQSLINNGNSRISQVQNTIISFFMNAFLFCVEKSNFGLTFGSVDISTAVIGLLHLLIVRHQLFNHKWIELMRVSNFVSMVLPDHSTLVWFYYISLWTFLKNRKLTSGIIEWDKLTDWKLLYSITQFTPIFTRYGTLVIELMCLFKI